ncbi:MAG TPA: acyltransferase [Puia sp.]
MKHIKSLDTLRAFAVIFVIIGHWDLPFPMDSLDKRIFHGLFPSPKFGVNLFFVLSGFLITSILLDARSSGEKRLILMRNFIARRTLRIFPIYYLAIGILCLVQYPYIREHLIWFLTYTSNILSYREKSWNPFFHTWSLSVEEQFYLVWPWLIIFVRPRYLKYVFYAAIAVGVVSTLLFRLQHPYNEFGLNTTPTCMQSFGIGGLYAYFRGQEGGVAPFMKVINMLMPFALLLHFYWGFSKDGGHFNDLIRTKDAILSIWLIHYSIVARPGWIRDHVLENRVLLWIGRVSYGLYVYHFALPRLYTMAIHKLGITSTSGGAILLNELVAYGIQLVFLFLVCYLSYEFIEKPILRLKRYFEYKKREPKLQGKAKPAANERA